MLHTRTMPTILAATDLTPDTEPALRLAARLARDAGASLHVVHAMGLIGLTLREAFAPLQDGVIPRARAALEAQVRRAVPPAAGPASCALDYHDLPRALASRCREIGADLVVLGIDRRRGTGGKGWVETAMAAAAGAGVPVLIPADASSWPPARVRWGSPEPGPEGAEAWLGRLALVATGIGCSAPPPGGEELLVLSLADARAVAADGAPGDGLRGTSILLLPPEPPAPGACGGSNGAVRDRVDLPHPDPPRPARN